MDVLRCFQCNHELREEPSQSSTGDWLASCETCGATNKLYLSESGNAPAKFSIVGVQYFDPKTESIGASILRFHQRHPIAQFRHEFSMQLQASACFPRLITLQRGLTPLSQTRGILFAPSVLIRAGLRVAFKCRFASRRWHSGSLLATGQRQPACSDNVARHYASHERAPRDRAHRTSLPLDCLRWHGSDDSELPNRLSPAYSHRAPRSPAHSRQESAGTRRPMKRIPLESRRNGLLSLRRGARTSHRPRQLPTAQGKCARKGAP